jgi:glycosyltransferase involved in cell wall biosynthesis
MRIIYLHQYFNTPDMPGATRSYELARRLVEKGHEVHMVTSNRAPDRKSDSRWKTSVEAGITVHWVNVLYSNKMSFWARLRSFFTFALRASTRTRSIPADVVFASSTPLTVAVPAILASRKAEIPMVFEVRDLWPEVPIALGILRNPIAKWSARKLERIAYRNSSHIVALAPGMKEEIAKTGYPPDQITVIPNGCDVELFTDSAARARELRLENDWLGDRPLIVYVGALGRINSVDYLVDIARHFTALDPEIRIAVVGTGIEAERIENRAIEAGVYEKNFFMIGQLPKKQAAAWVSTATMTVALVRGPRFIWKDATQNKFFDSLAAARPVAANYDGWQAKVASAAGAGFIMDKDDAECAARQLAELVNDKRWLAKASSAAISLARGEYSRDRHADELEQVLKSVAVD